MPENETASPPSALIVGASRGIGLAMVEAFARRGWHVTATARGTARSELHALAEAQADRIVVEQVDINEPKQIPALRDRLSERAFDVVFVNAGVASPDQTATIAETDSDAFAHVMGTNVLGVMCAVEELGPLARVDGVLGVMSSGQGSIANNNGRGDEVYRASKAALNQSMRSYAARHAGDGRALVLMAPGWIRTDLGGSGAPFGVDEAIPPLVDTLIAQAGTPGLRFIDRHGAPIPW